MSTLAIKTSEGFDAKMNSYPDQIMGRMTRLRALVRQVAEDSGMIRLEETLKWGEPSFIIKQGSTLRMDWKSKSLNQYAMYFSCSSRLVDTFKIVFGDTFRYEGKRAILFDLTSELPEQELKRCIAATLRYHEVKEDIKLGM